MLSTSYYNTVNLLNVLVVVFSLTGFLTPGQTLSRTALQIGNGPIPPTPATVVPAHNARRGAGNNDMGGTAKDF